MERVISIRHSRSESQDERLVQALRSLDVGSSLLLASPASGAMTSATQIGSALGLEPREEVYLHYGMSCEVRRGKKDTYDPRISTSKFRSRIRGLLVPPDAEFDEPRETKYSDPEVIARHAPFDTLIVVSHYGLAQRIAHALLPKGLNPSVPRLVSGNGIVGDIENDRYGLLL